MPRHPISSRRQAFKILADKGNYQLIAGSKYFAPNDGELNVADHIVNGVFEQQIQKKHRVPILESNLQSGENALLAINDGSLGVGICFDIAFSTTMRRLVQEGAEALLILSNDASFGHSGLTYMHLRYASIRAMENARQVLFLSNTGPSVVISDNGRVVSGYIDTLEPKNEEHEIELQSGISMYAQYPLTIPLLLLVLITLVLRGARQ